MYVPTHRSIHDGSDAMRVKNLGPGLHLANEDGWYWEADPAEWVEVDPADPYGYMEGISYS